MVWLESLRRQPVAPTPSRSFVPFNRANFGSFKDGTRRR
jgi:hypothetical protein